MPDLARIKTYRDVLNEYRVHIEAKSLGPDGQTKPAGECCAPCACGPGKAAKACCFAGK